MWDHLRGRTLTDRGRLHDQLSEEDEQQDIDDTEETADEQGQADLKRWTG